VVQLIRVPVVKLSPNRAIASSPVLTGFPMATGNDVSPAVTAVASPGNNSIT
jgi:hypothetical protein